MIKTARIALFASLALVGCTQSLADDELADIEEEIGSAEGALNWCTQHTHNLSYVPYSPTIYDSTLMGPMSALCLDHRANYAGDKTLVSLGRVTFPQYSGAYSASKLSDCQDAWVRLTLFQTLPRSGESQLDQVVANGEPDVDMHGSLDPANWTMTCEAIANYTHYYPSSVLSMRQTVIGHPIASNSQYTSRIYWTP